MQVPKWHKSCINYKKVSPCLKFHTFSQILSSKYPSLTCIQAHRCICHSLIAESYLSFSRTALSLSHTNTHTQPTTQSGLWSRQHQSAYLHNLIRFRIWFENFAIRFENVKSAQIAVLFKTTYHILINKLNGLKFDWTQI